MPPSLSSTVMGAIRCQRSTAPGSSRGEASDPPTAWPDSGHASLRHSHSCSGPASDSLAGWSHVGHAGGLWVMRSAAALLAKLLGDAAHLDSDGILFRRLDRSGGRALDASLAAR